MNVKDEDRLQIRKVTSCSAIDMGRWAQIYGVLRSLLANSFIIPHVEEISDVL